MVLKLAAHIFVADKADYYRLEDGLPRYEGGEHGEGLYLPATGARARHMGDPERSGTSAYGTFRRFAASHQFGSN
jgi:hypothetical protein